MATSAAAPAAREIADRAELSENARALARDGMTPEAFVAALDKADLARDALAFLAHWQSKRQAVWWGCQCLWHVFCPHADARIDAALGAVVGWVLEPNEGRRRSCEAIANQLTAGHPAGALALAAFASDGSLSAPGLPAVPPPAALTATTVTAALVAAAARLPDPPHGYRQFVRLGLDVAHGRNSWKT